jgi:5-methylcytosine-specific restriction protein A
MPYKPKRICNRCGRAVSGRCECQKVERPKHQQKTGERGYGWDWQVFRKQYLTQHPLCLDCLDVGRTTVATEVHHMVKVKDDPTKRLDPDNMRALCGPCHRVRSARGE